MSNIEATRLLKDFARLLQSRGLCGAWTVTTDGPAVCGGTRNHPQPHGQPDA